MSGEKKSADAVYAKMLAITNDFIKDPIAAPFVDPIASDAHFAKEYFERIKKPMDLTTIKRNLSDKFYSSIDQWVADFNLIFDNAVAFNGEEDIISSYAKYLKRKFAKRQKELLFQNTRTIEAEIIKLRNQLAVLLLNPPNNCGMKPTNQQLNIPVNEFSTGRIYNITEGLNKFIENADFLAEVKTILEMNDDSELTSTDVNLSRLGKNKLVALEGLLKKQESSQ